MIDIVVARIRSAGLVHTTGLVALRLAQAIANLGTIRFRICECCFRTTCFVRLGVGTEAIRCVRCGANLRYEMLARVIRNQFGNRLRELHVLELDPNSPLRRLFDSGQVARYVRTYFDPSVADGTVRKDGSRMENLERLSAGNSEFDLVISSDVLEHVPDLNAALRETARVLKPGGSHIFTVPPRSHTKRRAEIVDGKAIHLVEPEYHLDPLRKAGILTFWDIGPDVLAVCPCSGLTLRELLGPLGREGRCVWSLVRDNGMGHQ